MNQAFLPHFPCNGRVPVNPRLHLDKHPVGMISFQLIQRILIGSRKLLHIRIADRRSPRPHHSWRGRKHNILFCPLYKIFVGSRQIAPLYVTGILFPVLIKQRLIPDIAAFIQFHPRNLHGLSADYGMNGIRVRRWLTLYLVFIAQIYQRKNTFILYDFLKVVFCLLQFGDHSLILLCRHFHRDGRNLYLILRGIRNQIQLFIPFRIKGITLQLCPRIILFALPFYLQLCGFLFSLYPNRKRFREQICQLLRIRFFHKGQKRLFLPKGFKGCNVCDCRFALQIIA